VDWPWSVEESVGTVVTVVVVRVEVEEVRVVEVLEAETEAFAEPVRIVVVSLVVVGSAVAPYTIEPAEATYHLRVVTTIIASK